jgi:hypothetical protein
MHFDRYNYLASIDYKIYVFYSQGPKGRIEKMVSYEKVENSPAIYNLAFGDIDPATGLMSDRNITDNGDRDTVLTTVADTVSDFSDHHNKPMIYIVGSTLSRTRLYQMSITKIYEEIASFYIVQGYREGQWEIFQKNVNYEAFVVQKK